MSVNAYRIINNNLNVETASFDIWHDEKFIDFLNEEILFYMSLNSYGTGIVDDYARPGFFLWRHGQKKERIKRFNEVFHHHVRFKPALGFVWL